MTHIWGLVSRVSHYQKTITGQPAELLKPAHDITVIHTDTIPKTEPRLAHLHVKSPLVLRRQSGVWVLVNITFISACFIFSIHSEQGAVCAA